jgi:periplasmic divalent cation tolerance protein
MECYLIYITTKDKDEARKIGRHLVRERLAACVNIFDNMNSMYIWQDQFHDEREAVMVAKTTAAKVSSLVEAVKAQHSYECPCIVSLPITGGHQAFLGWIEDQVV